ncbi:hypothetical protein Q7C36_021214 [Tachysurus vachellii]|uniref:B-cell receptor CD22 n=1 Tax=Tachysurus vachellii TaxID=175792 RepID=A0AA88IRU4_TACVA|nr:hypothetical protein Q7C36_021214 [Tachysurus vachellii]
MGNLVCLWEQTKDLKVTVSDWYRNKKLSCITTCTLSNKHTYIWYKNGQRVTDQNRNELDVSSEDAGSFSCAVRGHEELRSPAVCVFDEKSCWSVTYSTQTICGLIGSSVDIHSYFTFPNKYKVMKMFWFIKEQVYVGPVDMSKDKEYQGRVQYTQSSQNNCSLRITNLRERDAQTYMFRLYSDDSTGKATGEPGVSLSVTDLKVTVSDSGSGQIDLSCITTCTLSNKPTYIWYKNGQHGDSVTLSCSSDANPPVFTYSWFKQSSAADTLLITGQNYSISNISSQHRGLYYCTAHNQLGHHNSTPTHLDVFSSTNSVLTFTMLGLFVFLALTLIPGALWMWKRKRSSANGHSSTGESGQPQSASVYENISASNRSRRVSSQQDDVHYASVVIKSSHTQEGSLSPRLPAHSTEEEDVQYAEVNVSRRTATIHLVADEEDDDTSQIYSKMLQLTIFLNEPFNIKTLCLFLDSPKNTTAVVLSSGDTVEGDSVTLSCSSDANPPVLTYSWFKQSSAADTLLITGQNYSISNISSQHTGLYYCTAHNQLGHHNSTPIHLDVFTEVWKLHAVRGAAAALVPALLLSLLTAFLCVKRKKRAERDIQCVPKPGDDTYTGLNLMTISPDYDTLQVIAVVKQEQSQNFTLHHRELQTLRPDGLIIGVQAQHSVTFSSQSLCVVIGSTVKIPCTFTPDHSRVTERQWYRVQSSEGEPQDLRKDPEYSGRVSVNTWWSDCSLTVSNVRVSDSGVYNFRFKTQSSDWISASSGVQLNVTDLQVKVDPNTVGQREVKVTCSSTCRLNTHGFNWYRNGHYIKYAKDASTVLYSTSGSDEGSYSCQVYGSEHRSPPVYLKVTVSDLDKNKKLSCITTCTLSNKPTYIWYKNGQRVTDQDRNELNVSSEDAGSFSCAVRGQEELRSPAVCFPDEKSCWSVTYSTQTICGLISSSVDIHSYFTFPNKYKVMKMFWFIKQQVNVGPVDMSKDKEYQGRVQYTQSSQNDCSLRITNLRERDAQTYRFRLYTDDSTEKYTGEPGVSLSVTDLKVTVSDSGSGQIDLSCITTCSLSNKPTYIWYKNGQRVSECKSASCSVAAVSGAVSYSCAVEGHDSLLSPPVCEYSPKNTTAVVLSSGDTVEGDSVTLSCSSDANPPVLTYSWFKQSSAADTLLITGQNYSISEISSQHRGLYYCTAHNQLGHHNSTPTLLVVIWCFLFVVLYILFLYLFFCDIYKTFILKRMFSTLKRTQIDKDRQIDRDRKTERQTNKQTETDIDKHTDRNRQASIYDLTILKSRNCNNFVFNIIITMLLLI